MRLYSLITLLLSYNIVFGQLSTGEKPMSFSRTDIPALETNDMAVRSFAQLDMQRIMQEDIEDKKLGIPPRFGYKHKVNYNLDNSGEWITLPDGGRIWRLAISSPGAVSINLLYDKFWIPDGAKFWIYSYDGKQSIGAFTSKNNRGTKEAPDKFATGLIFSDQIILEYYLPKGVGEVGSISIVYVVHSYRRVSLSENFDGRGFFWVNDPEFDCHININCSFGLDWQTEKNAVALILVNGHRGCTGFLINNTANDGHPFFMTAHHCLIGRYDAMGNTNLGHWSFVFHFEAPSCYNVRILYLPILSGATLIANNLISDFALLLLNEDPRSPNSGITPYYLGWCRDVSNPGVGGGVVIHHPNHTAKKISRAGTGNVQNHPSRINWGFGATPANSLWRVDLIEGTTEVGSSGAPFLNHSRRVIGQNVGGLFDDRGCPDPTSTKFYGKFGVSWRGSVSPNPPAPERERRLDYWLDPLNTGAMFLDGSTGCVSTFSNQPPITTDRIVTGCYYLDVRNVTVTNGATLTLIAKRGNIDIQNVTVTDNSRLILYARGNVNLGVGFSVELGSQFEMR